MVFDFNGENMTKMFNNAEITTMSDFDIHPEWGVQYFWDGIAAWMNKHLGTPWLNAQEMIDAGVRYACAEAGQHYHTIDDAFIPYTNQSGVEVAKWGGSDRDVAKWNGEVVGVDVVIGRVRWPNEFQRLLKVMSPECIDYFILFPKLKKSEMEENLKRAADQLAEDARIVAELGGE